MYQAKCRYCGAELIFARTALGKKMPLDAAEINIVENEYGITAYRVINGQAIKIRGTEVRTAGPNSVKAYRSHMATCECSLHGKKTKAQYMAELTAMEAKRREREKQKAEEAARRRENAEKEAAAKEAAAAQMCLFRT